MWWQILISILGAVIYLYLGWRVLKENYREEDTIAFGWVSLALYLIGSHIAYGLMRWGSWMETPVAWLEFWKLWQAEVVGGYIVWLLLAWLVSSDRGWKYFAFVEDSLVTLFWINGVLLVLGGQWKALIALGVAAIIGVVLRNRYRSFVWYKSGRKGFLFLITNIMFFAVLSGITMNYWWLIPSLICGVGLVILGNDKLS